MGTELAVTGTGLEHLPQTLAGYRAVLADKAHRRALQAMERLPRLVPASEPVVCFCQARRRESREKANVVLVLTTRRFLVVDEKDDQRFAEAFDLDVMRFSNWERDTWHGTSMVLDTSRSVRSSNRIRTYNELRPFGESRRIAFLLGAPSDAALRQLLDDTLPAGGSSSATLRMRVPSAVGT